MPQKFNEVKIDRRDNSEKVLRSVMIDQFTADTLNGDEKVTGIKYVLAEEVEDDAKKAEKAKRDELFKTLKDAGVKVPGLTKTDKLEQMVAELNKI